MGLPLRDCADRSGSGRDQLAVIVDALRQSGVALTAAIVFGSVARGSANAESDLDLAVVAEHELSAGQRSHLIEQLAEVTGRPVDLVDLRRVGEPLLGEILRDGLRLFGADDMMKALILRHIYADADFVPLQRRILAERRQAWIGA